MYLHMCGSVWGNGLLATRGLWRSGSRGAFEGGRGTALIALPCVRAVGADD
jgi:hypothetical protein